jgi:hypothetical protein
MVTVKETGTIPNCPIIKSGKPKAAAPGGGSPCRRSAAAEEILEPGAPKPAYFQGFAHIGAKAAPLGYKTRGRVFYPDGRIKRPPVIVAASTVVLSIVAVAVIVAVFLSWYVHPRRRRRGPRRRY